MKMNRRHRRHVVRVSVIPKYSDQDSFIRIRRCDGFGRLTENVYFGFTGATRARLLRVIANRSDIIFTYSARG